MPTRPEPAEDQVIPWERRRELGWWRAFRDTLVMSVRQPSRFYGLAPHDPSPWGALAYGLVFDLVVASVGFAYHLLVGSAELESAVSPLYPQLRQVFPDAPELIAKARSVSAIGSLLLTPVFFVLNLLLTTVMTWIGLRLARGLHTSFGRILRMFAYASWIQIFGLVAVTGDVVLSALSFALVLGFGSYYWLVVVRESQRIDNRRAMVASLYGCLVAFALACVVGFPILVGVGLFLASFLRSMPSLPQ